MIQPSNALISHVNSSLAGKRKLSQPKKKTVTDNSQLRQGTSGAGRPFQTSDSALDAKTTQDLIHISSGSSSSLNLNYWDAIIRDYFDIMTNKNESHSHQTESNQGLRVTGDAYSPQIRPNLFVNADQPVIIEVPDSAETEGRRNYVDLVFKGILPTGKSKLTRRLHQFKIYPLRILLITTTYHP